MADTRANFALCAVGRRRVFLVNYLGYGLNAVFIVTVIALALYAGIISIAVFNGAWRPDHRAEAVAFGSPAP